MPLTCPLVALILLFLLVVTLFSECVIEPQLGALSVTNLYEIYFTYEFWFLVPLELHNYVPRTRAKRKMHKNNNKRAAQTIHFLAPSHLHLSLFSLHS